MAKKVKSDSLVSTISVEAPKVTELNITRADLISYVTAEARKQHELDAQEIRVKLGKAVGKYFDRCIENLKVKVIEFNEKARANQLPEKDLALTHSAISYYIGYLNASYDSSGSIRWAQEVSRIYDMSRYFIELDTSTKEGTDFDSCCVYKQIKSRLLIPKPTADEVNEMKALQNQLGELVKSGQDITDKSTKTLLSAIC